jgi:hypothetical protein
MLENKNNIYKYIYIHIRQAKDFLAHCRVDVDAGAAPASGSAAGSW